MGLLSVPLIFMQYLKLKRIVTDSLEAAIIRGSAEQRYCPGGPWTDHSLDPIPRPQNVLEYIVMPQYIQQVGHLRNVTGVTLFTSTFLEAVYDRYPA
ncbi:hypothetical protein AVEN_69954-1 [Araneus ventricosus]|uniref:Uncharacterized protein n=1 Tax=Araneus ventricosus TaxID=182803 RepID=A0A4Y2Q6V8_ARAVE|nr:hypothetical protein AVEN_69954-1 [Araneus ventricosus]